MTQKFDKNKYILKFVLKEKSALSEFQGYFTLLQDLHLKYIILCLKY